MCHLSFGENVRRLILEGKKKQKRLAFFFRGPFAARSNENEERGRERKQMEGKRKRKRKKFP